MIYTEYGKTHTKVSKVGFGGMRFDLSKSDIENAKLLLYARSKGINYFDTAPGYSDDRSEDIFGIAFKQMRHERDEFYVSTKGMPTEYDTADKAIAAVEKSLKRLNVDKIDFYHVWCIRTIEQYKQAMKKGGQYEGLLKCKEKGMIDNIAVSTHLPGSDIQHIIANNDFEGVLLGVNILNFLYRWQGIQAAYDAGLGVVAMNPLAGGVIPQHEKELSFLATGDRTPTESALHFCIGSPQITITLVGFTTQEHIDTACRIADSAKPLTQTDRDRIAKHLSSNLNSICTGCGYCMNDLCPEGIPVANYMQFYNEKLLSDKNDEAMITELDIQYTWGMLVDFKAGAKDCTKCGKCQKACTQHLNIIERLAQIAEWDKKIKT